MIRKRHRIVSLVLASMVFLSTSMNSMALHYCSGQFAGVKLFKTDLVSSTSPTCGQSVATCCIPEDDKGCCEDEVIELDWDHDMVSAEAIALTDLHFADIIPMATSHLELHQSKSLLPQHYIPPLQNASHQVLFQQFLL